jgi:hypothetical protein
VLTGKVKPLGTASATSPTPTAAAAALRRQVAHSPHRNTARALPTLGGEEPDIYVTGPGTLVVKGDTTLPMELRAGILAAQAAGVPASSARSSMSWASCGLVRKPTCSGTHAARHR